MSPYLSPWQILVVPIHRQPVTYILFRIHHLLLVDQPNLNISDFLLVDHHAYQGEHAATATAPEYYPMSHLSPFNNVLPSGMSCITELCSRIAFRIVNYWNEFRDHTMKSMADGKSSNPVTFAKSLIVVMVTVAEKCFHNFAAVKRQLFGQYLGRLVKTEFRSHNLNWDTFYESIGNVGILYVLRMLVRFHWLCFKWIAIDVPTFIIKETFWFVWFLWALSGFANPGKGFVAYLIATIPLVFGALGELFAYICFIINAPRQLWDLAFNTAPPQHALQTKSTSGRKVIAWSDKMPLSQLNAFAESNKTDMNSEVLLTWLAAAILECLQTHKDHIPGAIGVSARCVNQNCLLGTMSRTGGGVDGLFCCSLPLGPGDDRHLQLMRESLADARKKNTALYSLTKNESRQKFLSKTISPILIKLFTNYLSKKYSITITDVVR